MLKPDENMSARPVAPRSKPSKDATRMNSVVSAGMALRQLNLEKDLIETREALFALQLEAETQARERADEEARSMHQTQMRVHARSDTLGSMRVDPARWQMDTDAGENTRPEIPVPPNRLSAAPAVGVEEWEQRRAAYRKLHNLHPDQADTRPNENGAEAVDPKNELVTSYETFKEWVNREKIVVHTDQWKVTFTYEETISINLEPRLLRINAEKKNPMPGDKHVILYDHDDFFVHIDVVKSPEFKSTNNIKILKSSFMSVTDNRAKDYGDNKYRRWWMEKTLDCDKRLREFQQESAPRIRLTIYKGGNKVATRMNSVVSAGMALQVTASLS